MSKTSTIVLDEAPLTIANVIRIAPTALPPASAAKRTSPSGVPLDALGKGVRPLAHAVLAMLPIGSEGETVLDLGPMVDAVRRAVA